MKTTKYLLLMLLTLLGAKGLNAQTKEAYAYLSEDGKTLAFYYNGDRSSIRTGTTYGMNTGTNSPNWNAKASNITTVIFDRSFADYHPTTCYSWFRNCSNIDFISVYNLQNLNTDQVTDMSFMFTNCTSLTNFNLSHFDTSNVTSMKNMFSNCTSLECLDLSHFDTSNVTDMSYMFSNCSSLTSLDVSNFDTSNVTDIYNMFYVCSSLTSLDVSNFDTSNVIVMSGMFSSCTSLESLDVSNFDTSNVTDMDYMFMNCSSLTSLDLSSFIFNQSSNNNFAYDCSSLKTLTVPATANFLNSTAFNYVGTKEAPCTLFYPEDFTPSGTSNYNSYFKWKGGYFKEANEAYAHLSSDGLTLTFYYDRNRSNREGMTFDIKTSYAYPTWNTKASNITTVVFDPSFANYHPTTCSGWFCNFKKISNISELQYFNTDQVTDMFDMFYGCSSLTSLDLSHFDTSNVTDMSYMFNGCSSLTSLDVSGFNTSNVTNMQCVFFGCSGLTSLDLSNFDFSSVSSTGNDYLLRGCSGLKTLTIPATADLLGSNACTGVGTENAPCVLIYPSSFTPPSYTGNCFLWKSGYFKEADPEPYVVLDGSILTFYYDKNRSNYSTTFDLNTGSNTPEWYSNGSSVESVVFDASFGDARPRSCSFWFFGMTYLTTITGIENLKTDEVTEMMNMFGACINLNDLDVSGFNTSNVTNMSLMFQNCRSLTSLDVSNFDTPNVTDMSDMFIKCSNLTSLDVSNFKTENVTDFLGMFEGCSSLTSLDLRNFSFNSAIYTESFLKDCSSLKSLAISATAINLKASACEGVGTAASPCTLIYPEGFTLNPSETGEGWFKWKSGYFKEAIKEAYAVLDGSTLTFYYDKNRSNYTTTYDLNTGSTSPGWYNDRTSVESVVFDSSFADARPTSCYSWFAGMKNLTSITGIEYLNTEEVTTMVYMFNNCTGLESLDLSGFNTAKVTRMYSMFSDCSNMTALDVSGFNTTQVTDMRHMFYNCSSVESLDLSSFTFSTNSSYMLYNCSGLKTLTISSSADRLNSNACYCIGSESAPCALIYPDGFNLNPSIGTSWYKWKDGYFKDGKPKAYAVFHGSTLTFCYDTNFYFHLNSTMYSLNTEDNNPGWYNSRTYVTTVVFDTSFADVRPTSCYKWFYGMSNLTTITGIGNLKTDDVTNMYGMFYNCSSLTSLDVSTFNTTNVTNMYGMFYGCSGLTNLDLSNFDFSSISSSRDTYYLLKDCIGLETLIIPATPNNLNANACEGVGTVDDPCTLIYPDGFTLNPSETGEGWFKWKSGYFKEAIKEAYAVLDGSTLTFYYDKNRSNYSTTFDLNTGSNTPEWYSNRTSVESVVFDASFADARPTSCYYWFYGMKKIKPIEGIKYLNTSEVTTMYGMFYNCINLTSLDVSHFDTSNVTSMSNMFWGCHSLKSLDVSGFNTSNVNNMTRMFYGCSGLTNLDVSGFNTEKVTTIVGMFFNCSGLTSLDLSNFDFSSIPYHSSIYTDNLLSNCIGLKTLIIPAAANDYFKANACTGVGTDEDPCVLIYPSDMEIDKTGYEENGYFMWKSGYFKENNILPGDANEDDHVTVADVMLTVNKVLGKTLTTFNETNADVNSDGKITVSDVMGIVKIVLGGSGNSSAPSNAFFSFSDGMALTAKGSELTLHLTGTGTYTATQMTVTLPEGCRLESAQIVASRSNGHSVLTSDLGNGHYRVVIYSASGLPFGPSCTDLLRLRVSGHHNGDLAVSDIQVVDPLTATVLLSDVSGIATGIDGLGTDASSDGDWYTTQGQRVSTPTRGVYIRNGQKKVVR